MKESKENYIEPIQAAFDEKEVGKPLDWKSLNENDKAFISALRERDPEKAKTAIAAGAKADIDCGYGCNSLMLAAATGDEKLVAAIKKAGAKETPEAEPYMEILNFPRNAQQSEFKDALAEIEQILNTKPITGERAGLYSLEIESEAAKSFLEKHHTRLLNQFCYVFLHEQHFKVNGKPDLLWILPTKNKYSVMAFTGVNGINYDIENHLIIRWMKRLERDHPFNLTGCGFDFLSGRFTSKLGDTDAMARRMYLFCPDIVDQGTESVQALADELKKTNEFFFWWD